MFRFKAVFHHRPVYAALFKILQYVILPALREIFLFPDIRNLGFGRHFHQNRLGAGVAGRVFRRVYDLIRLVFHRDVISGRHLRRDVRARFVGDGNGHGNIGCHTVVISRGGGHGQFSSLHTGHLIQRSRVPEIDRGHLGIFRIIVENADQVIHPHRTGIGRKFHLEP